MFNNCGEKIQKVSTIFLVIGIISACIVGVVVASEDDVALGIVIIVAGSLSVYISALVLNGFGVIVDYHEIQYSAPLAPTTKPSQEEREKDILADGGWKCACGRINYKYMSSCESCGKSKLQGEVK